MLNKPLSVSQLNSYIRGVFEDELILHNISVYGEVTEFKVNGNNTYFTILDNNSELKCVKFSKLNPLSIGMKVLVSGKVTYYDKSGKVSFVAFDVKPYGDGEQYAKLLLLKDKLKGEGLFDNCKPYPEKINNIAIITSETGAVIHDFLTVIRKYSTANIYVLPVRVQGDTAQSDIVSAISLINEYAEKFDIAVIARGGGSNTDLSVFNTESIARAVASCKIHIISAIGHEVDYTLCDLCADSRAGTPSIAAEQIAFFINKQYNRVTALSKRICSNIEALYQKKENRLRRAEEKITQSLDKKLAVCNKSLLFYKERLNKGVDELYYKNYDSVLKKSNELASNINKLLENKQQSLAVLSGLLDKSSPLKILESGYAKVKKGKDTISSVEKININDEIDVIFSNGYAKTIVKDRIKIGKA